MELLLNAAGMLCARRRCSEQVAYVPDETAGDARLDAEDRSHQRLRLQLEVRLLRVQVHAEQVGVVVNGQLLDVATDVVIAGDWCRWVVHLPRTEK